MFRKISIRMLPLLLFPAVLLGANAPSSSSSWSSRLREKFMQMRPRSFLIPGYYQAGGSIKFFQFIRDLKNNAFQKKLFYEGFSGFGYSDVEEMSKRQGRDGHAMVYRARFRKNFNFSEILISNRSVVAKILKNSCKNEAFFCLPISEHIPEDEHLFKRASVGDSLTYYPLENVSERDIFAPDVMSELQQMPRRRAGCRFDFEDDPDSLEAETRRAVEEYSSSPAGMLEAKRAEWEAGWQVVDAQVFLNREE